MKTQLITLITYILFHMTASAQPFNWVRGVGGTGDENVSTIRIDNEGNLITCGNCSGNCLFGSVLLPDSGAFIAKYDSSGNVNWVIPAGDYSAGNAFLPFLFTNLEINSQGYIYAIGVFNDTGVVGNITLTSYQPQNIFLSKIDSGGNVIWARKIADHAEGTDITIDQNNNIVITGTMRDTAHFDSVTFINYGLPLWPDIFIAKYDSMGTLLWAKQAGGTDGDVAYSVSCDNSGNIFIGGEINGDANFDALTLTVPTHSGFVTKYNPFGAALWAKHSGYCSFAVAADSTGNCYTGGYAIGEMFDTISLPSPGAYGIFVAKLNSAGMYQWARGSSAHIVSSEVTELKIDETGNCFAIGNFKDSLLFDNVLFVQPGSAVSTHAAFILEFTPSGQVIAGKRPMNAEPSDAFATAIDVRSCNIAFAGVIRDTPPSIYFDNDSILSNGQHDLFVSRINNCLMTSTNDYQEISTEGFVVYPNPSKGSFIASLNNIIKEGKLMVFSQMGVKVFESFMNDTSTKDVYLKYISSGIYFIKIFDGEREFHTKLIIEHN